MRALIVLIAALAAGALAAVLAGRWLATQGGAVGGARVVVAAADIELGTQLTPQLLQVVNWPKDSVPKGAFSDSAQLLGISGQVARVLRGSVVRGEPIVEAKLAPPGTTGGLASIIRPGKRAMTVSVNEIVGVAGFALPGNYVDILVSTQDERAPGPLKQVSKFVVERVLVLAIAQETRQGETRPRVVNAVTLEVTPEEAERIDLARSVGSLTLVLRPQMERGQVATTGARVPGLLTSCAGEPLPSAEAPKAPAEPVAAPAAKPAVRPPPRPRATPNKKEGIEVIRGINRSLEVFPPEGK